MVCWHSSSTCVAQHRLQRQNRCTWNVFAATINRNIYIKEINLDSPNNFFLIANLIKIYLPRFVLDGFLAVFFVPRDIFLNVCFRICLF